MLSSNIDGKFPLLPNSATLTALYNTNRKAKWRPLRDEDLNVLCLQNECKLEVNNRNAKIQEGKSSSQWHHDNKITFRKYTWETKCTGICFRILEASDPSYIAILCKLLRSKSKSSIDLLPNKRALYCMTKTAFLTLEVWNSDMLWDAISGLS